MVNQYPLPREKRETPDLVGNGAVKYGPFNFKIFDVADVVVDVKRPRLPWKREAVSVAKITGAVFDYFTITFSAAIGVNISFRVKGVRLHDRSTDLTRGGTIVVDEMEKETSKQGVVLQEIRRDLEELPPLREDMEEAVLLTQARAQAAAGHANAANTSRAQAETARNAAQAAKTAAEAARNEAVSAKNTAVAAKDSAVAANSSALSARDTAIANKNTATTARNEAITAKNEAVNAKNESVVAKNLSVNAKNETVTAKNQAVAAKNEAVAAAASATAIAGFDPSNYLAKAGGIMGGEINSRASNGYRLSGGSAQAPAAILHKNAHSFYVLLTNENDRDGDYNNLRPLTVKLTTGDVTFNHKVDFADEIQAKNLNGLRFVGAGTSPSVIARKDGSNFYFLLTDASSPYGNFNNLRPFHINLTNGRVVMNEGLNVAGSINITSGILKVGTATFSANGAIKGEVWEDWHDSGVLKAAIFARIEARATAIATQIVTDMLNAFKHNPTFTGTLKCSGDIKAFTS